MEQKGFFKWLWRINGVVILIAVLAFFWLFYDNEIRDRHHEPRHQDVIDSMIQEPKSEELSFGQAVKIGGSNYNMLPLVSKNSLVDIPYIIYEGKTSGKLARNILFINKKENSSVWLFKDNNQVIEAYSVFPSSYPYVYGKEPKFIPKIIYYKVLDRNGKNRDLALSDISGKNYRVIAKNIGRLISVDNSDKNSLLFIYQKDGVGHSLVHYMQFSIFNISHIDYSIYLRYNYSIVLTCNI